MKLRIIKDIPGFKKGDIYDDGTDGYTMVSKQWLYKYEISALIKDGYAEEVKGECCNLPFLPDGTCSCSCHSESKKPQKPSEIIREIANTIERDTENIKYLDIYGTTDPYNVAIIKYLDEQHENK